MSYISEGFSAVTPMLIVESAAKAIDYYKSVFGATERLRMEGPGGSIMHAEIDIDGAIVMLTDANPEQGSKSPGDLGGSPQSLMIYVPDVDATIKNAVGEGSTETMPATDMFWGDRMGRITDPFGHSWSVGTHVKDVPEDEMAAAQEAWMKEMAGD